MPAAYAPSSSPHPRARQQLRHVRRRGRAEELGRRRRPARPGLPCITATRSASSNASRRSWVTSTVGEAEAALEREEGALKIGAGDGVERAERLVEEHDVRAARRAPARSRPVAAARPTARAASARRPRPGRARPARARGPRGGPQAGSPAQPGHERHVPRNRASAAAVRPPAARSRRGGGARTGPRWPTSLAVHRHDPRVGIDQTG